MPLIKGITRNKKTGQLAFVTDKNKILPIIFTEGGKCPDCGDKEYHPDDGCMKC